MRLLHAMSFLVVSCLGAPVLASFVNFESQHVHPVAFLEDPAQPGDGMLFVVNTPDNRLAVFNVAAGSLDFAYEVPVGLDPVSVAVRHATEAWVVNHISDTVSIVDLTTRNVRATLQVGDEPTDVVFAGPAGSQRAFVCVSQENAVKIYQPRDVSAAPVIVPLRVAASFQVKLADHDIERPKFLFMKLGEAQGISVELIARPGE